MVIPLFVGRPKSIKALETSMESGKNILLVAQKTAAQDDPTPDDLYDTGSVATVLQMLKLPDGTVKVLVEGNNRARVLSVVDTGTHLSAQARVLPPEGEELVEVEAMRRALLTQFDQYVKLNKKIPPEILTSLSGIDEGGRLADTIVAHLPLKLEQKQEVLEMIGVNKRLEHLLGLLEGELDILQVEKRIRGRVKRQMEKSQREYYLNEQVKAIQKELGDIEEGAELEELEKRIKAASMSKEAEAKAMGELKKLRMMSPMSAEATVIRSYIEAMVGLPWKKHQDQSRSGEGRAHPRRGSLWSGQGQGTHPRVSRRAAARRQGQGANSLPGRSARGRQDLARSVHRACDQSQVRPHGAWRRA
jgi:ATP-dependent Lon protease